MFKNLEQTYWEVLRGRAWILTKEFLGINLRTGAVSIACIGVGTILQTYLNNWNAARDKLVVTGIYFVPFLVAVVAVYLANLFRAGRTLHDEQAAEIARHEDALNAYSKHADLAERLVEFRREGVKLRNRRLKKSDKPSLDGLQIAAWKIEVDTWQKSVLAAIKGQVSAKDYGRFETLDAYAPMSFGWQINSVHSQYLAMLSRRIQILLEIMGQF